MSRGFPFIVYRGGQEGEGYLSLGQIEQLMAKETVHVKFGYRMMESAWEAGDLYTFAALVVHFLPGAEVSFNEANERPVTLLSGGAIDPRVIRDP
jgi:hypothetical protein